MELSDEDLLLFRLKFTRNSVIMFNATDMHRKLKEDF
jgi:hypothetical protein